MTNTNDFDNFLFGGGKLNPEKQDDSQTTYAKKITKEEALINWHDTAEIIERNIRALQPWPVAHTLWDGKPLKIGAAEIIDSSKQAEQRGRIVHVSVEGIDVATAQGTLRILKLQLPSAKMISARDFLNSHREKLIAAPRLGWVRVAECWWQSG